MSKEIRELLESAKEEHNDDCMLCAIKDTRINSVLKLLKQQPPAREYETRTIENIEVCSCGNIFVEDDDYDTLGSKSGVCCPSCGNEKFQTMKDRLDRAEARIKAKDELLFAYESVNAPINPLLEINKDLLELCKELMEKADNGSADFDDPEPGSIYLRAEAAIAKAKE